MSEEGRRQQAKLKELQAIAERLGCTLPQLAIGTQIHSAALSLSVCLSVRPSGVSSTKESWSVSNILSITLQKWLKKIL